MKQDNKNNAETAKASKGHAAPSGGATAASAGPPQARPAPSGGSERHAGPNVGATSQMTMIQALRSAMDVML